MATKRPPLDEQKSLWEATVAAEGITTGAGAADGKSIVDAGLALSGANSFFSMLMVLYPGQPRLVDSMDITGFTNGTGEVIFSTAYKGIAAAIPAGTPYKIVTFRFVPAEVAAIEGKLDLPVPDAGVNTRIAEVVGNLASTAIYAKTNTADIIRYLKGLLDSSITAWGAADAGSGVGAVVDAARTEANDWWNGQTILILTGAAAFQKRPITDFDAPSDTISVGPNFDAAVAAGDLYVILAHYNMIVPRTADDVANALTSDVIGRKDDSATPDDMSLLATSSLVRDLKRVLLRMGGVGIFSADIQGASRIALDTMLAQLATYLVADGAAMSIQTNGLIARTNLREAWLDLTQLFGANGANVFTTTIQGNTYVTIKTAFDALATYVSALGAAYSATVNPGAAAKNNVEQTLEDLGDMLAGATGIVTFPAGAAAANGVSIAEVVRYIQENLVAPTVAGNLQVKATTIDLNQAAATYVLFTANAQDVVVEKLVIRMSGGALAAPFTYFTIQTDDATPNVFIDATTGAVANLTNEAQLTYTGAILVKALKKIRLTIAVAFGGTARVSDVVAEYRAVVAGGYLT